MIVKNKTEFCMCEAVPFEHCFAKTFTDINNKRQLGRSVLEHCLIVGKIAQELVARYPYLRDCHLFPDGVALVAACHDIGKVNPAFCFKLLKDCQQNHNHLKDLLKKCPFLTSCDSNEVGHAMVSQLTAIELDVTPFVPDILGQHHGFRSNIGYYKANDEIFGGENWQKERVRLVEALKTLLQMDWPHEISEVQAPIIAGLVSVSDWIGSSDIFIDPDQSWEDKIQLAVDRAGFIVPKIKPNLKFGDIFNFSPKLIQQNFIDIVDEPGVFLLEAPMGIGKTEAALYAAYRILEQKKATGIYFALPTQSTSNKIYERFNEVFLRKVITDYDQRGSLLLHSNSALLALEMGEEGVPGKSWFNQNKRGLLAPFAVGTVDQALMAVMNVTHGFVRAFGLAGKVVILDEVHSYDLYTGTILNRLIEFLKQAGCTVIVLSATLCSDRRQKLLNISFEKNTTKHQAYPLITSVKGKYPPKQDNTKCDRSYSVAIKICVGNDSERNAIENVLERAESGQQVLWIENTVREAQSRYLDLATRSTELGIDCGLIHSHFTVSDRKRKEDRWIQLYGKDGALERCQKGRILIGTQVLEQSLDIDADFLVTRFCPTDMLLQRLGRLWRHPDLARNAMAKCEAWLLCPHFELVTKNPKEAFGLTACIYDPYILYRSLEIWYKVSRLILPQNIRSMIEETYRDREEEYGMLCWKNALDREKKKLEQLAYNTSDSIGNTLSEARCTTRYFEQENCDILLLKDTIKKCDKEIHLKLYDGHVVKLMVGRKMKIEDRKKISVSLMKNFVKVPLKIAPNKVSQNQLKDIGLHRFLYLGSKSQNDAVLRVVLVESDGILRHYLGSDSMSPKFKYRQDLGYYCV